MSEALDVQVGCAGSLSRERCSIFYFVSFFNSFSPSELVGNNTYFADKMENSWDVKFACKLKLYNMRDIGVFTHRQRGCNYNLQSNEQQNGLLLETLTEN